MTAEEEIRKAIEDTQYALHLTFSVNYSAGRIPWENRWTEDSIEMSDQRGV